MEIQVGDPIPCQQPKKNGDVTPTTQTQVEKIAANLDSDSEADHEVEQEVESEAESEAEPEDDLESSDPEIEIPYGLVRNKLLATQCKPSKFVPGQENLQPNKATTLSPSVNKPIMLQSDFAPDEVESPTISVSPGAAIFSF